MDVFLTTTLDSEHVFSNPNFSRIFSHHMSKHMFILWHLMVMVLGHLGQVIPKRSYIYDHEKNLLRLVTEESHDHWVLQLLFFFFCEL